MTPKQKFFRFMFVCTVVSLMILAFLKGTPVGKRISDKFDSIERLHFAQSLTIEKFMASDQTVTYIKLSKPVKDSLQDIWDPFLPQEVYDSLNFNNRTDVNVLDELQAREYAKSYNQGELDWRLSAYWLSFDLKPGVGYYNEDKRCHYDPTKHGFILQHSGVTLGIKFITPQIIQVLKLSPKSDDNL